MSNCFRWVSTFDAYKVYLVLRWLWLCRCLWRLRVIVLVCFGIRNLCTTDIAARSPWRAIHLLSRPWSNSSRLMWVRYCLVLANLWWLLGLAIEIFKLIIIGNVRLLIFCFLFLIRLPWGLALSFWLNLLMLHY